MLNNFLAFVAATIASMLVGIIWYSPKLFGNLWAKGKGITMEQIEAPKRALAISILVAMIKAAILLIFVSMPRVTSFLHVTWVCLLLWGGFILTSQMLELAYGGKKLSVFLIDSTHALISTIVMGLVLFVIK